MECSIRRLTGNAKVIKIFRVVFRYIVPLAALVFLVYFLFHLPPEVFFHLRSSLQWSPVVSLMLALLVFLSIVNWMLESLKWRLLSGKLEAISFSRALYGVLYGVALGMVTPKRSGEFLGRAMLLKPHNRMNGVFINAAGSFSQLFITLAMGLTALLWSVSPGAPPTGNRAAFFAFFSPEIMVTVAAILLLGVAIVGIRVLAEKTDSRHRTPAWMRPLAVFREVSLSEMLTLCGWSLMRYFIFVLQFFLILKILLVPIELQAAFMLLAITYLFLSPLPISSFVEVGVRGAAVLLVYEIFFAKHPAFAGGLELSLVAAMLGLWLVNLALPAMAGALLGISGKLSVSQKPE
jgi:hypothetical protein